MARLGKIEREIIRQLTECQPKALREIVQDYCALQNPDEPSPKPSRATYESFRRAAHSLKKKRRVIHLYRMHQLRSTQLWLTRSRRLEIRWPFTKERPEPYLTKSQIQTCIRDMLNAWGSPVTYRVVRKGVHQHFHGCWAMPPQAGAAITKAVREMEQRGEVVFWRNGNDRSLWKLGLTGQEPDDGWQMVPVGDADEHAQDGQERVTGQRAEPKDACRYEVFR